MVVRAGSTNLRNSEYTEEELMRLSSKDKHYELVEGKLVEMSPAGARHGEIALNLGSLLREYIRQHKLGKAYAAETGFRLKPGTVRGPDVAFVARGRLKRSPAGYAELAPDLVVEVISPNDTEEEVTQKVTEYLELGVRLIWVVHPGLNQIIVYRHDKHARLLQIEDELEGEDVVPGFKVNVREIFAEDD